MELKELFHLTLLYFALLLFLSSFMTLACLMFSLEEVYIRLEPKNNEKVPKGNKCLLLC
jgi:hypothetical protein